MPRLFSRHLFASAISCVGLACWAASSWADDPKTLLPEAQAIQQVAQETTEKATPTDLTSPKAPPTDQSGSEPAAVLPGAQADQKVAQESPPKTAAQEQPLAAAVVNGQDNGTGSYWTSLFNRGHLLGGAGIYVVEPIFDSNRAFHSFQPAVGGATGPSVTNNTDFDYHLTVSPRLWIGYVGEGGWGVRVNAWHFDQSATAIGTLTSDQFNAGGQLNSATPAGIFPLTTPTNFGLLSTAGNVDVLTTSTRLKFTVLDFEATKAFTVGDSLLLISAGARLARIDQQYNATLFDTGNDPTALSVTENLGAHQRFIGAGPTVSFEGHCPIGNRGLGLYGLVRGALLVGEYHNAASSSAVAIAGGVETDVPIASNSSPRDAVVPAGEFELGAEWNGTRGRVRPLLRVGVTGQSYRNALNNNNDSNANNGSSSLNGSLTFFGFTVTAGITY